MRSQYITGYVDAVITDGIEIGRPCCKVAHCSTPLASTQDHYCPEHQSRSKQCYVEGCQAAQDGDWRTCTLPEHRAIEEWAKLQNKASFTLRRRLQRSKVAQPTDSIAIGSAAREMVDVQATEVRDQEGQVHVEIGEVPVAADGSELPVPLPETAVMSDTIRSGNSESVPPPPTTTHRTTVEPCPDVDDPVTLGHQPPSTSDPSSAPLPLCPERPAMPSRSLRAMFGRRRTHNEQLIVRPCGIIIRRETFYGSETVRQVLVRGYRPHIVYILIMHTLFRTCTSRLGQTRH